MAQAMRLNSAESARYRCTARRIPGATTRRAYLFAIGKTFPVAFALPMPSYRVQCVTVAFALRAVNFYSKILIEE
jgi:hypothetical protein